MDWRSGKIRLNREPTATAAPRGSQSAAPPPTRAQRTSNFGAPARARTTLVYYRRNLFLCQNMKIHHILRPEPKGMWWFCGCLTPVRLSQSWGSWAERWREGIRSANLIGSCSSGMTRSKILTHSPKTTCQAPSDLSTDWPPNSASFSLGSTSKVTWVI